MNYGIMSMDEGSARLGSNRAVASHVRARLQMPVSVSRWMVIAASARSSMALKPIDQSWRAGV